MSTVWMIHIDDEDREREPEMPWTATLAKQGDPEGDYSVGTGRTVGEAVMDALTAWGEKL